MVQALNEGGYAIFCKISFPGGALAGVKLMH